MLTLQLVDLVVETVMVLQLATRVLQLLCCHGSRLQWMVPPWARQLYVHSLQSQQQLLPVLVVLLVVLMLLVLLLLYQ